MCRILDVPQHVADAGADRDSVAERRGAPDVLRFRHRCRRSNRRGRSDPLRGRPFDAGATQSRLRRRDRRPSRLDDSGQLCVAMPTRYQHARCPRHRNEHSGNFAPQLSSARRELHERVSRRRNAGLWARRSQSGRVAAEPLHATGRYGKSAPRCLSARNLCRTRAVPGIGQVENNGDDGSEKHDDRKTDSTAPVLSGSLLGFYESQNLTLPAQNASVGLTVAAERFADSTMDRLAKLCNDPAVVRLADESGQANGSPAPPAHRTLIYKAASEYMSDCSSFANFRRP